MCGADCWPVSESGTENILEATLMVFRGLQRTWPTAVQPKVLNFLRVFSQGQNSWPWLMLISRSRQPKKETEVKLA